MVEQVNPKIFYLIGALRDGCLTTGWTIKYKQKVRGWLSVIILPIINEIFKLNLTEKCIYLQKEEGKTEVWYLAFRNKRVWNELNSIKNGEPKTNEEKKFYIMGFWDADGGCPKFPEKNKKNYIKFTQKDRDSLEKIKDTLEVDFGINCGNIIISEKKNTGNIWRLVITNKDSMIKFCNKIGSLHPEKKLRLKKIRRLLDSKTNTIMY